jgi:hypothetical protein
MAQELDMDGKSKADKQLSTLSNTLKNMINTSNKVDTYVEKSLTVFLQRNK